MVIGYHVIFCAYGFWLPNDPRGSWSDFVGAWELFQFGRATKTDARRSVAGKAHDCRLRQRAKRALKYAPVRFSGVQARAVGRGFGDFVERSGLSVWACSILPEHVHLVVGRFRYKVEQIVNLLKGEATRRLSQEGLHPFVHVPGDDGKPRSPWARREWKVYLDSAEAILRAIRYVEHNPIKEGKRPQRWPFIVPFEHAV